MNPKVFFLTALFIIFSSPIPSISADDSLPGLNVEEKKLVDHINNSIRNAENGISKLDSKILAIEGYSSNKVRHFLNNLCSFPGTCYLEIGCWKGSTLISALYKNNAAIHDAIGIDNWSEFKGPQNEFLNNCSKFLTPSQFRFFSVDCFSIDKASIFNEPINIYFFDGYHSLESHELALTYYDEILNDLFILIVDDWNWVDVQKGTRSALEKLNYKVLFSKELLSRYNGDLENWWNGIFVALIRKKN
jgi:hypothetical protein